MTTPHASLKQRVVIAFSCVLVGCAVGATMPRLAAQSFPPNPTAQRWEQVCDGDLDNLADLNRIAAARSNRQAARPSRFRREIGAGG